MGSAWHVYWATVACRQLYHSSRRTAETAARGRLFPRQTSTLAVVQSHAKADQWANEFAAAAPRGQADLEVTQVRATPSLTDSIV
jgi:hypothetical protein